MWQRTLKNDGGINRKKFLAGLYAVQVVQHLLYLRINAANGIATPISNFAATSLFGSTAAAAVGRRP